MQIIGSQWPSSVAYLTRNTIWLINLRRKREAELEEKRDRQL
jgi:hypothetical protein